MEDMRTTYKVLVRKLEGKRPIQRPRRRWEDNIVMDRRDTFRGREWMRLKRGTSGGLLWTQ